LETSLDAGEKLFAIGLFCLLAFRMFHAVGQGASGLNYLQLAAEGLVVVLILFRRPAREMSLNPVHWALAIGATAIPLLVRPEPHVTPLGPPAILMISGIALQIWAKLTLRFSFGLGPANRGVVITGPYQFVRHPIYAAYLMGQFGFLLLNPTLWNAMLYTISLALQVMRLKAEDEILGRDPAFTAYKAAVCFRLLPGVW
jgi:protein-S-isoprenylcysteine O-methyltransferase Ste14